MNNVVKGRIENWSAIDFGGGVVRVSGELHDNNEWPNGTSIFTSRVREIDHEYGIVITQNSIYLLGTEADTELKAA